MREVVEKKNAINLPIGVSSTVVLQQTAQLASLDPLRGMPPVLTGRLAACTQLGYQDTHDTRLLPTTAVDQQ